MHPMKRNVRQEFDETLTSHTSHYGKTINLYHTNLKHWIRFVLIYFNVPFRYQLLNVP